MGCVLRREVPALDHPLKALALRHRSDVDRLSGFELREFKLAAELKLSRGGGRHATFPQAPSRAGGGFAKVTRHRLGHPRRAPVAGRDLQGAIAVAIDRLHLRDAIREHLDDGHGNRRTVCREDARHPALSSDESNDHEESPRVALSYNSANALR